MKTDDSNNVFPQELREKRLKHSALNNYIYEGRHASLCFHVFGLGTLYIFTVRQECHLETFIFFDDPKVLPQIFIQF